jgi:hypothetical protein
MKKGGRTKSFEPPSFFRDVDLARLGSIPEPTEKNKGLCWLTFPDLQDELLPPNIPRVSFTYRRLPTQSTFCQVSLDNRLQESRQGHLIP